MTYSELIRALERQGHKIGEKEYMKEDILIMVDGLYLDKAEMEQVLNGADIDDVVRRRPHRYSD
jgi:hypothetical protein